MRVALRTCLILTALACSKQQIGQPIADWPLVKRGDTLDEARGRLGEPVLEPYSGKDDQGRPEGWTDATWKRADGMPKEYQVRFSEPGKRALSVELNGFATPCDAVLTELRKRYGEPDETGGSRIMQKRTWTKHNLEWQLWPAKMADPPRDHDLCEVIYAQQEK